ncbi:MAG: hypothetical protein CBE35_01315 [Candidatus Pelagibacter sp. TMED275]|nr:MAG: hypothetical protein CBE35_01315 [Candidatus Pelagibacter sp. TMED275]|tara:strand:- start:124 stop:627 length:504 start_codon:yes stop_codon:yes gene_type:complete
MCSVELAVAGLKVGSAVAGWQADRQQASNQAYADYKTKQNADQAYLTDLSKIETERGLSAREKGREEMRAKMKAKADLAAAQNAGFGNDIRVAQDIGVVFDQEYNDIAFGFEKDMITLNNQRGDAYANLQRIYNNIAPVYTPTTGDLLLRTASAGMEGYATGKTITS